MMLKWSALLASCGNNSQMRMPGTLVAIGEKRPRYSSGASGFGSQVSSWEGPPQSHKRTTDLAEPAMPLAPAARNRSRSARDKPSTVLPPACKKARRVSVWHVRCRCWPTNNMRLPRALLTKAALYYTRQRLRARSKDHLRRYERFPTSFVIDYWIIHDQLHRPGPGAAEPRPARSAPRDPERRPRSRA